MPKPSRSKARYQSQRPQSPAAPAWASYRDLLAVCLLLLATLIAYSPALHGEMIWDDDAHITRPDLRSGSGLYRIWFELGATQQYYPLVHSTFWLEHRLWGDHTLGYHLVNLALHFTAALLVAQILRKLHIPGALLAATIFALHPVHVETVAWITELKNTLSAVFYLSAMLMYLKFDQTRDTRSYTLSLALFSLGLLSKTVTATLPAALLVIFWWQRGRLSWKTDVQPLLPFFVLGAAGGLLTAWVEHTLIGASGSEFEFSFLERCLIAGRVPWFYLSKLIWPLNLIFIYPRWEISRSEWWQYLFPLATAALLITLWLLRKKSRAPLAALLFFGGTLFPVLGFFNVYPFRFSFVADHFQYLASLGPVILFSSLLATLSLKLKWPPLLNLSLSVVMAIALGYLSWQQQAAYRNEESLWIDTLQKNPQCWMAHNNLGMLDFQQGRIDGAIEHFQQAIQFKANHAEAHNNLGNAMMLLKDFEKAEKYYRDAIRYDSHYAEAHNNLGTLCSQQGRFPEAADLFLRATQLNPHYADAFSNLGNVKLAQGDPQAAIPLLSQAIKIDPQHASAHCNLGIAWLDQGNVQAAVNHLRLATRYQPQLAEAHFHLGVALTMQEQFTQAIEQFNAALHWKPDYPEANEGLRRAEEHLQQKN